MNSCPRGRVFGQRTVIIAAGGVYVPIQERRIEVLLVKPVGEGDAIQIGEAARAAEFERDGEIAATSIFREKVFQALELFAIFRFQSDGRLDALLPTAIKKQPLLWRETQIAIVRDAIFQNAEIFEQFADINCLGA